MSWSCPFRSFQLPLHVPVIFSVCPLYFPCMSRSFVASHFPTSPAVPIGFLVRCFPFIPPALPLFSFLSLSRPLFPFHFPLLSCHVDFLFPPLISLHFLAFPLCSPVFPAKKHSFPAFSHQFHSSVQGGDGGLVRQAGHRQVCDLEAVMLPFFVWEVYRFSDSRGPPAVDGRGLHLR